MDDLNIQEKIIVIVNEDPFMKIVDIAEKAGTTEKYVRTVLSGKKISLAEKREEYYRRAKKDYEELKEIARELDKQQELIAEGDYRKSIVPANLIYKLNKG